MNLVETSLPSRSLELIGSPAPSSKITQVKDICLVDKNRLLVYGHSTKSGRVFELHQLENNSGTKVIGITELQNGTIDYLMHNCDYTGGAWFRSTNEEEQHVYYDSVQQNLY